MEVLDRIINTLEQIKEDLPRLIGEVMNENKTLIEDLNIKQLQEGKRSDGSTLPDYSPTSVFKYGKKPGPMVLEDTGAFYRGIEVKVSPNFAEIIGTDPKTKKLENSYGVEIVGISEEHIDELVTTILLPGLREKVKQKYFAR